ncbi:mechanosensitive ion channel family protein [Novipirellula artificiosorum]|uniref:Low conductance mechanosensitive channel YnaI n=1 Tax=Novipirellula artificiosorum TaxID=2528016 RepID=A0A5C6DGZ2_9BACT|nr:mechanosensitive ion channel family protein [Novipirellula artificiosorum]TWU34306.1 Low conductance mechanosensitive channel YnaI [Novipirellula artificiosorum]
MIRFGVTVLCIAFLSDIGRAQEAMLPHPLEPSDTSTPSATLNSLIDSCNELQQLVIDGAVVEERETEVLPTTERILDCLDLGALPTELRGTAGIQSALFLKEVLDRIDLPDDVDIPTAGPELDQAGTPFRWQIPGTRLAIASPEQRSRPNTFLFTPETVRRAAEFYRVAKRLPYRDTGRSVSPGLYDAYTAATKKQPTQSTDTSSPRGTLTLFLDSCNELYLLIQKQRYIKRADPEIQRLGQRIISCLDRSQLPDYSRDYYDAEAAVCLKEVLDRIPLPPAEQIPGIESVESIEGAETLFRWQVPRTQIAISKMQEGPRRGEFLFSAETVSRAPELYEKVRMHAYRSDEPAVSDGFYDFWLSSPGNPVVAALVEWMPKSFQRREFGMSIWQWISVLLMIPICLTLMLLFFRWGRCRGQRARGHSLPQYWLSFGFFVVAALIPIGFKYFVWEYLSVRGGAIYTVNFCSDLAFLFGILGLIVGVSSRAAETMVALPQVAPGSLDANLIRIIFRVLGIVAAVIVFLEGGRYLGFPLTTLIASAGIGGLAIALSAQGLVKGLFGTVAVLLDKPYGVGERIVVKGHDGFVEEIGLRSTKIRTLAGHLISIPNDQMADAEIENIARRELIRRSSELHIPIDTSRVQVEMAVDRIRALLENHEGMDPEHPPRVFFGDITPSAFTIEMIYWYGPPDLWAFKAFNEKVNLAIFEAFEKNGIQFSLPFRHSYWKQDDQQGPLEVVLETTPRRE